MMMVVIIIIIIIPYDALIYHVVVVVVGMIRSNIDMRVVIVTNESAVTAGMI